MSFIQKIAASIYKAPPAGQSRIAVAEKAMQREILGPAYFDLELVDSSDDFSSDRADTFSLSPIQESVQSMTPDRRYQLVISASRNSNPSQHNLNQQGIYFQSALELQLVPFGPPEILAALKVNDNQWVCSPESVFSSEHACSVMVAKDCPRGEVHFLLCYREAQSLRRLRSVADFKVRLEGNYNCDDQGLRSRCKIELDTPLPEQVAILHVSESQPDKFSLSGWSFRLEPWQSAPIERVPIKLADFVEQAIGPETVIGEVRNFSRRNPDYLLRWLKKLLDMYGEQLCLIIADHTGFETPWEMLEIEDERYLGAHANVVRWIPAQFYDRWRLLKIAPDQQQGAVMAYLAEQELGVEQTYDERMAFQFLKVKRCGNLQELKHHLSDHLDTFGLIYLGCHGYHGEGIGTHRETPAEQITRAMLELPKTHPDPRPLIFVNACDSARLKRDRRGSFAGLLEVMLVRYASGYIGTLGPVGSACASHIAGYLLHAASTTREGILVAEALRELRAEAARTIRWQEQGELSQEEKKKQEEQRVNFIYTFMYVYYGNALTRLQLTGAEAPKESL